VLSKYSILKICCLHLHTEEKEQEMSILQGILKKRMMLFIAEFHCLNIGMFSENVIIHFSDSLYCAAPFPHTSIDLPYLQM
jgi:hypothetical protein